MVKNPKMETFYYVQLIGISVGDARVPGVTESDLRLDHSTGRGGVIVDSGTSVTRFARPAYSALCNAFRAAAAGLRLSPAGSRSFCAVGLTRSHAGVTPVGLGRVNVPRHRSMPAWAVLDLFDPLK